MAIGGFPMKKEGGGKTPPSADNQVTETNTLMGMFPIGEIDFSHYHKLVTNNSQAWIMRICYMVRQHKTKVDDRNAIMGYEEPGGVVYYLERGEFLDAEIAAMLAIPISKVPMNKPINLPKLEKDNPTMPQPTVLGVWGEA